ncbi:guanylate-binding protein 3-like [Rhinophrynus dorsalis]
MESTVKMEAPVCLIENTSDGQLLVNPEAMDILSKIRQPVVVVAIVGLYRTGKSYLLNKLAGKRRGFDLGSTIQAQTKGIWMWCVPHPTKENHTLVLLDTEGLGDIEKGDKKNDIWIFCLSVLLSSALVYNSIGTIDQDAIEKLQFVTEITEKIKVKSSDNDDEEAELSKHFPIFIWTVRDINLSLELDGKSITEDEYLESALKLKEPEKTNKIRQFNFPKKCIRMYFKKRKCFVFDRPAADKEILQRIEKVPEEELVPSFLTQTKNFCKYVYNNAEVKLLDGLTQVTGSFLGQLAKKYTETINSGQIPCMENAVLALSELENRAAVEEASRYYEKEMTARVVFPTETMKQFMDLSGECEEKALKIFMKKSFKDKDQKFQGELMVIIQQKKKQFLKENEAASSDYCRTLIKKLSVDLEKAIDEGSYIVRGGHQKFKEEMKKIVEEYNEHKKKGIKSEDVLQEFLKDKETIGATILNSDNALNENEKKLEAEKAEAEAKEMKRKVDEERASQEKQKIDDQKRTFEEHLKQLTEKMEMERRMMWDQMGRIISEKRAEQQSLIRQGSPEQAELYVAQIADLEKERRERNEPAWYSGIVDSLKSVAVEILPSLFSLGGQMVTDKINAFWAKRKK